MRRGIPRAAPLLFLLAEAWGECRLPAYPGPFFVGDTVRPELACDGPVPDSVAWEFGDGSAPSASGRHAYGAPGLFTVFARFPEPSFPATTVVTIVHRPTSPAPTRSATLAFDTALDRVFAVNSDQHTVSGIDAATRKAAFESPAGRNPRTLALGPGGTLWVTSQDDPQVIILDARSGSRVAAIPLPFASRPYGIAFEPSLRRAYVSLEAVGRLLRIDAASRRVEATLDLGPTPRGIAVSHDGSRILVTRRVSRSTTPGAADFGEVWEVDGTAFALRRTFRLEADTALDRKDNGRGIPTDLSSITISPDGRMAYVPGTKANTRKGLFLDGSKPTFETSVRTLLMGLDLVANREDMATRKDLDNRSMASSLAFDRMGRFAWLTQTGVNRTAMLQGSSLREYSTLPLFANTPAVLLAGEAHAVGPVGSVLDGKDSLLYVHYALSREIGVYDITRAGTGDTLPRLALIRTVGRESLPREVLVGKQIFHQAGDERMSKEGYLNCAVCHLDGGSDGRVWDFTDRGEGLRRTTSLLGRAGLGHGPVHWSANFDEIQDFEHDMRGPFGGRGFLADADFAHGTRGKPLGDAKRGRSPELDALAAYVASLARVPDSPYRNADGTLTEEALRGREVFSRAEVGCAACHVPPLYTDSRLPAPGEPPRRGPVQVFAGARSAYTAEGFLLHDVGTLKPGSGKRLGDTLPGLDTPTLKGVWTGGPYLHDGSAATLEDVLANPGDRHGKTSHLTAGEKQALVAFLLQLDDFDDMGKVGVAFPGATRRSAPSSRVRRGRIHRAGEPGPWEVDGRRPQR